MTSQQARSLRSCSACTALPTETRIIFVVDDDRHVREGIRRLPEADGHTVEDFETSEAFLEAYHRGREGCLLVDPAFRG
jgi:two-component system, chemotaxis family, CheB/CheR fusion protein